jgi:hypothetical protein
VRAAAQRTLTPPPPPQVYDTVVPIITGFVVPAAAICVPYLGVTVPGGLLASPQAALAVASVALARANTVVIDSIAVTPTAITGTVSGLPTDQDAQPLLALLYTSRVALGVPGGSTLFSGPVPGCDGSAPAVVRRTGATGTFSLPCVDACAAATDYAVVIASAATPIDETENSHLICMADVAPLANARLPMGPDGVQLASLRVNRAAPPPPSPSASAGPSASGSNTPTPYPTPPTTTASFTPPPSPAASPAAQFSMVQVVIVTVTEGAVPNVGGSSGAAAASLCASAALAIAAAAAMTLV